MRDLRAQRDPKAHTEHLRKTAFQAAPEWQCGHGRRKSAVTALPVVAPRHDLMTYRTSPAAAIPGAGSGDQERCGSNRRRQRYALGGRSSGSVSKLTMDKAMSLGQWKAFTAGGRISICPPSAHTSGEP